MEKDGLSGGAKDSSPGPEGSKGHNVKKVCVTFFRDEASLHGIRYVFLRSPWFCRRCIWFFILLTAIIVFIYLNTLNLLKYLGHPSQVSVDVSVRPHLDFPAVTICNYNKHRFSRVTELGLFDDLFTKYEPKLSSQPVRGSWYQYRPDLCLNHPDELMNVLKCQSNLTEEPCSPENIHVEGISSHICEHLCSSRANDQHCNGFWYNRTSSTCHLSTVLMKKNVSTLTDSPLLCKRDSLEYYNKEFNLGIPSFICTFDVDDCAKHMTMDEITILHEPFVIAKANKKVNDFTALKTYRGRYLRLFETSRRPGYFARFTSKMHIFKSSCVEFYYRFLGMGETKLKVQLFTQHKTSHILGNVTGKFQPQWQRFFAEIPDGPGIVYITASRSKEIVTTGLIIDNFGINPCESYKRDCLRNKTGVYYEGKISVTKKGYNCIARPYGPEPTYTPYCRNPDDDEQPWCFVDNTTADWDHCDIPMCPCAEDDFLCTKLGVCISKKMMCDGQWDCEDGEDELVCESKMSLSCSFEDTFVCGYYIPFVDTLSWQRKTAREIYVDNGPKEDFSKRKDSYFLYVDTQAEEEGSTAFFWSPLFNVSEESGRCVSFHMRSYSKYSSQTRLQLYIFSGLFPSTRALIAEYDLTEDKYEQWEAYTVRLPSTDANVKFQLLWMYYMGLPAYSNIAIDNVRQHSECDQVPESNVQLLQVKDAFNCSFADPDNCDLGFQSYYGKAWWKWAPRDVDQYAFANHRFPAHFSRKGTFRTPGFPEGQRETWGYLGRIKGSNGSSIKLTFFNVKFTKESNCSMDYLQIQDIKTYCGLQVQEENEVIIIEESEIELWTWSMSGNITFHGMYELMDLPYGNSLILYNEIGFMDGVVAPSIISIPTIHYKDINCLSMDIVTKSANISIYAVGYNDHRLMYPGQAPTTLLRINLPKGFYAMQFNTVSKGQTGTVAVINSIKIEPGWCPNLYDKGEVNCEFNEPYICGYMDFSSGRTRWHLGSGGMTLKSSSAAKTAEKANLVSPTFSANETSCLRIHISARNDTRLHVSVFTSDDVLYLSNAEFYELIVTASEDQKFTIPVRNSARRAMFTVAEYTGSEELRLHKVNLISDLSACGTETSFIIRLPDQVNSGMEISMETFSGGLNDRLPSVETSQRVLSYDPPEAEESFSQDNSGSHRRRNFTEYFNVRDLNEETAHQLKDMVFSCKFNDEECDLEKDFIRERTPYGVCYTYNSGKNNTTVKKTSVPGSKYGLRLVLNIETYENNKGLKTDDGVKIHIHSQDEIPYVQYVGQAAAVSHHTYFKISRHDVHSMKPPYGSCGEKELSLYPNDTYTPFRCNQQCETLAWMKNCGCIDHYMPGNASYCMFPEWEDCRAVLNVDDIFSCDCPTACHSFSYPSQSSFSSLASLGVSKYLLEEEKIKRIKEQLENSVNMDYRMLPQYFMEMLKQLQDVAIMLEGVIDFIKEQSTQKETSKFSLIDRAMMKFHQHVDDDIMKLNPIILKLNEEAACIEWFNSLFQNSLNDTLEDLVFLRSLMSPKGVSSVLPPLPEASLTSILRTRAQRVADFFIQFFVLLYGWCTPEKENSPWLPEHLAYDTHYKDMAIKSIELFQDFVKRKQILDFLNTIIPKQGDTYKQYVQNVTIKNAVEQLYIYVLANATYAKAMVSFYPKLLKKATEGISQSLVSDHKMATNPDYNAEGELEKELRDMLDLFKNNFQEAFFSNSISIAEIARNLSYYQFENMGDVMKKSKSIFQNRILNGLNLELYHTGPLSTFTAYIEAFSGLIDMYPVMPEKFRKEVTQTVRNMKIWRKPSANIDTDEYVEYDHNEQSLYQAWPKTLDLSEFFHFRGENILQNNIDAFYNRLGEELYTLEKDMVKQIEAFEGSYESLNNTLKSILENLNVNEKLLLKNFLKVDVFYGELVHHLIETSPAYPLTEFFNGIGGYFGLLLGASCITLVEFLDLIVFNLYLQLGKIKKKEKRSTENGKEKTSTV